MENPSKWSIFARLLYENGVFECISKGVRNARIRDAGFRRAGVGMGMLAGGQDGAGETEAGREG